MSYQSYELIRECVYQGVEYQVVSVLDNGLLLAVVKADLDNEKFPLQTVVIPCDITYGK